MNPVILEAYDTEDSSSDEEKIMDDFGSEMSSVAVGPLG